MFVSTKMPQFKIKQKISDLNSIRLKIDKKMNFFFFFKGIKVVRIIIKKLIIFKEAKFVNPTYDYVHSLKNQQK